MRSYPEPADRGRAALLQRHQHEADRPRAEAAPPRRGAGPLDAADHRDAQGARDRARDPAEHALEAGRARASRGGGGSGRGARVSRSSSVLVTAMAEFRSASEFREVMDRTFGLMSTDPEMGPKLRDAQGPAAVRVPGPGRRRQRHLRRLRVASRTSAGSGRTTSTGNQRWTMTMSSEVANRYFQGKENVPLALARRRIKSSGDVKSALKLIPIYQARCSRCYREMRGARLPAPDRLSTRGDRLVRRPSTACDAEPTPLRRQDACSTLGCP